MARRNPVSQRQFLTATVIDIEVDGSEVSTTAGKGGLVKGKHVVESIVKGTSSNSNLVTITLRWPYGIAPSVYFQPITADCECRQEEAPTKTLIKVRTLKSTNLATGVDNADFRVLVVGTEDSREGAY